MNPEKITKQHVLDAITKIEKDGTVLESSTGFDVIINRKPYPPKEVMRYANLVANGKKEWPYSGGEPTNKYLTGLGFDVKIKSDLESNGSLRSNLVKVLKKTGLERATAFFSSGKTLLDRLSVGIGDKRITYGTQSNLGFSITIGQRYCLAVDSKSKHPWHFISEQEIPETDEIWGGAFGGPMMAYLYRTSRSEEIVNRIEEIAVASKKELERSEISGYRKFNNDLLEKALHDVSFRNLLFEEAFNIKEHFTNNKTQENMEHKIDLFLNTILYGPPGTGKTYKLNSYKSDFFTDTGISKSSDDVLKEKVASYPFWKLLGAILGVSKTPLTVVEIIDHPIIRARVNPAHKTKPNNLAWGDLQSYADDESTQLGAKYRRSIKLFHKGNESRWSIADDKKQDLPDIIGQELLDIAADPNPSPVHSTVSKTRFNFITFHQKYSYEDFIEGIKPMLKKQELEVDEVEEEAGSLQFELKKGIFFKSSLEALQLAGYNSFEDCYQDSIENRATKFQVIKNVTTKQFALFIDEINRANISAVLGELITLLEDDKRIGQPNEIWVDLPYSGEKFCVPPNLYVIGTMNTADRSIALLDIALRRRFEFKALYPLYIDNEWWAPFLTSLNQAIYTWKKNPDFFIGHAFFINRSEGEKTSILNTRIIPLLYEYCQNNADAVRKILVESGVEIKATGIKENFQILAA